MADRYCTKSAESCLQLVRGREWHTISPKRVSLDNFCPVCVFETETDDPFLVLISSKFLDNSNYSAFYCCSEAVYLFDCLWDLPAMRTHSILLFISFIVTVHAQFGGIYDYDYGYGQFHNFSFNFGPLLAQRFVCLRNSTACTTANIPPSVRVWIWIQSPARSSGEHCWRSFDGDSVRVVIWQEEVDLLQHVNKIFL